MAKVTLAPRLQDKADLMEGRILKGLNHRLDVIARMPMESLLRDSHAIRGIAQPDTLWVTRVAYDHRLIFRRTGPDTIEAIDLVSHDDLEKFAGSRP
jgi:hypothetical protein